MDTFHVTPVADKIYIFSGGPACGKSYFAKSIPNSNVIEDIHMGMDGGIARHITSALWRKSRSNSKIPYYRDSILIFITNDLPTSKYIKEVIDDWFAEQKRIGEKNW